MPLPLLIGPYDRRLTSTFGAVMAVVLTVAGGQALFALDFTFEKIVDSTTLAPGGAQSFSTFSNVAFDGEHVAFHATLAGGGEGIYLWDGSQLNTVANLSTPVPSSTGNFTDLSSLALDDGHVVFHGDGGATMGVYTTLGGALRRVADTTTQMPGSIARFTSFDFGDVDIDGTDIAFTGFGHYFNTNHNEGVYRESGGVLSRVVDRSFEIPDFGQNFIFFGDVGISDGQVVFQGGRGTGGGNGFYTTLGAPAGQVRTVLNANTSVPGLTNPISITSPNRIAIEGTTIAVKAGDDFIDGIYLERNGNLEIAVDEAITDPLTGNNFRTFGTSYSLSNNDVAFWSWSNSGPTGIYLNRNATIANVINTDDTLDGFGVNDVSVYRESLRDDSLVFRVSLENGTSAIYKASLVPTTSETLNIAATFDVRWMPGSVYSIHEGENGLIIGEGFGDEFPEKRAILEFPLDDIPEGATLDSVVLDLNPYGSSGSPRLEVFGYGGDGLASLSDTTAAGTVLAVTPASSLSTWNDVSIDPAFVESLLGSSTHLGIRLRNLDLPLSLAFDSSETTFSMNRPKLVVSYTNVAELDGDYNGDGIVDAADYTLWRDAYGATIAAGTGADGDGDGTIGMGDYDMWRENFGATLPAGAAIVSLPSAPVPEPTALMLVFAGLTAISLASRRGHHRCAMVGPRPGQGHQQVVQLSI